MIETRWEHDRDKGGRNMIWTKENDRDKGGFKERLLEGGI